MKKRYREWANKLCPKVSNARWVHDYIVCVFVARHYVQIRELTLQILDEPFGHAVIIDPLLYLATKFDAGKARFHRTDTDLNLCCTQMRPIGEKYAKISHIRATVSVSRGCASSIPGEPRS
jgi:hypothetical protein